MNSEHYADPTADKTIGNVVQERRREKKYGKKRIFKDDSRREVVLGQNRSTEKHRNKTKKAESITNLFNAKHTVRVSATTKRNDEAYNIKISEMEVINSGLITKSLYINQGIENNILLDDEIEYLWFKKVVKNEEL